jgi:uroporphyrinogen-III synthase
MSTARRGVRDRTRPLTGLRVLVGRARHQASTLSIGLRKRGAKVIEIPLIEIQPPGSYKPLDSALKCLELYDWMILTSVNGVEAVWRRMKKLGTSQGKLSHLRVAAIGPATRKAIEAHGLTVHMMPRDYVAEAVVRSMREHVKGKRVLVARAKVARDVIPRKLSRAGAQVDVVEAYRTVLPNNSRVRLTALLQSPKRPDVITFTSSSMARNFIALIRPNRERGHPLPTNILDGIRFASIGPVTSSTLRELGLPVHMEANVYTISGLIRAICDA